MLEHNGYKRFDKRKVLSYPEYKKSLDKHACKREPISYNGLRKSDAGDDFKQATFMVIDGSTNKKELAEIQFAFKICKHVKSNAIVICNNFSTSTRACDYIREHPGNSERSEPSNGNSLLSTNLLYYHIV